ncbi:MFS transporter [Nocardioides daejeonensis]|uniref:MFS transporter n=1 Tax=Nocardioides daejeonensis TaxID=1046556 RepID=UPI00194F3A8E|nr:MFS transporter [Nocardioides daejeonensis]
MTVLVPPLARDRMVHGWWAVKGLSDAGDAAWTLALAWTAVQIASPGVAGLIVAAGTVPRALLLLLGGAVADRQPTRQVLISVTLARLAVLAAALAGALGPGVSVPLLIAVAVGFGCCDALFEPASATLARQLVVDDDLAAYSGAAQTVTRLGTMAGAALGGGLVAAGGLAASALANAVTYVGVLSYLTLVLRLRIPLPRTRELPVLRSILDGFGYLRRDPTARVLVLTLSGLNLAVGPALGLGSALLVRQQGWGASWLGALEACVAGGALCAAATMIRRRPRQEARWGFVLLVVQGGAIMLLALPRLPAAMVACLLIGVSAGAASVLLSAVFMRTVAPAYLGRLASMQRLGDDVLMPAAMSGFGALAAGASLGTAFLLFGGAMSGMMAVALLRIRSPQASPG